MLVKLALEPEWETRFETNSYGFRPGRCTMDAIVALHATLAPAGASGWLLDADISGCFDNNGHELLLARLPVFTTTIRRWLKAGAVELGTLKRTSAVRRKAARCPLCWRMRRSTAWNGSS